MLWVSEPSFQGIVDYEIWTSARAAKRYMFRYGFRRVIDLACSGMEKFADRNPISPIQAYPYGSLRNDVHTDRPRSRYSWSIARSTRIGNGGWSNSHGAESVTAKNERVSLLVPAAESRVGHGFPCQHVLPRGQQRHLVAINLAVLELR